MRFITMYTRINKWIIKWIIKYSNICIDRYKICVHTFKYFNVINAISIMYMINLLLIL